MQPVMRADVLSVRAEQMGPFVATVGGACIRACAVLVVVVFALASAFALSACPAECSRRL